MKGYLLSVALVAAIASQAVYAETATNNWYVSGSLGKNSVSNQAVQTTTTISLAPSAKLLANQDVSWDNDTTYAFAFGYRYTDNWRVEVEYSRTANDSDTIRNNRGALLGRSSAKISSDNIMLNGFFDFNSDFFLKPYVGFGVGMTELEFRITDNLGGDEETSWEFAVQPLAGLTWSPAANWDVFAQYQYLYVFNPDITTTTTDSDGSKPAFSTRVYELSDHKRQSISLGVRYRF